MRCFASRPIEAKGELLMITIRRASALFLILAGVCNALFWLLALPLGSFAGRSIVFASPKLLVVHFMGHP
jgi:hypothetical protein